MKKILVAIMFYYTSVFAYADANIDNLIENKKYSELPEKLVIEDRKYRGKIPLSVYLMLQDKEDLAIELLNAGTISLGNSVGYKGSIYSEREWAELNGFEKFAKASLEITNKNTEKEDLIKRNREEIFTNMERLPAEIQKEKKLIVQMKEIILPKILEKENKDKMLINLLVKLIIDGNNDAATLVMPHIKDVNVVNRTGVTPLMATGFSKKLDGGNVEFANKLIFEYNADVNFTNDKGMSAVHIAAAGNAYKTLTTLINNKASFMRADKTGVDGKMGRDPIDYAIQAQAQESLFVLHKAIELLQRQRNIN